MLLLCALKRLDGWMWVELGLEKSNSHISVVKMETLIDCI